MKTFLLATVLAVAPVLAVPALAATDPAPAAATPSPRAQMMFWFLDRNGDGVIDATEITAFRTARFNALDTNGDGKLTKDEAIASLTPRGGHGPRGGKGPDQATDASGKGGENAEARKARFAERQQKRQERALERLGFTGDVTEVTLAQFLALPNPMAARADADKDGRITKAEFLAVAAKPRGGVPN